MSNHTSYTPGLSEDWDLMLDGNGNLAMLRGDRATVQNVANECRMFYHDSYFRYEEGIHWFEDILGQTLQKVVVEERLRKAALTVNGVADVESIVIDDLNNDTRFVSGDIEIKTTEGQNVRIEI